MGYTWGVIGVGVFLYLLITYDSPQFESSAWKAARAEVCREERHDMVQDLRNDHLDVGMTRAEIRSLLGPADTTAPWGRGPSWGYHIGYVGSDGCRTLRVRFDWTGRVAQVTTTP